MDLLRRGNGVLRRECAVAAGLDMRRIYALVAAEVLTRIAPGCFVATSLWSGLNEWRRFALRGWAFALTHDAHMTGWAATVLAGLPTVGRPPAAPTAILPKGTLTGTPSGQYGRLQVSSLPTEHRARRGALRITSEPWSVAEVIRTSRLPDGLVVADAALRRGVDFRDVVAYMTRWAGVPMLRWVAEHADPNAESPLESLGRFTYIEYDKPLPIANAWVGRGEPEWRVDGLLPWHWLADEGDGAFKYDNRPDASQRIRDQVEREYELRRLGLEVLRYTWSDVYPSRSRFAERIGAMLHERPARAEPIRWWKHVPGVGAVEPKPEDWPSPYPMRIILPVGWRSDARDSCSQRDRSWAR